MNTSERDGGEVDGSGASTPRVVERMLEVLESDIIPLTRAGVEAGNKIFGAAILCRSSLELVCAASNRETHNPLWHGEVACLNDYWAMPRDARPSPSGCLFLSTHEPCSMCLSAITWSGFDNFYYFFSYEDSRDSFCIPHDLEILDAVFDCPDGAYTACNKYWTGQALSELIEAGSPARRERWRERSTRIREAYSELSSLYQEHISGVQIPLP